MDKMEEPKKLFLIDGTALAYRSYFAFIKNPLINSKGINTGGVYGFTGAVLRIIKEEKPEYLGCVFDMAAPTFRHKLYPKYKATREKMPDDMVEQLPLIRSVVEAFDIPILEMEGFEADDIMGTLARKAEQEGMTIYLVTGDKDLMQLVSPNVFLYSLKSRTPGNGVEIYDEKKVKEKLGVEPSKVVDLLGLMGDTSDNVPGIPGVGPKTAVDLIERYGSLFSALENIEDYPKKSIKEKVLQNKDSAVLSRELVTIKTDVPVEFEPEKLKYHISNTQKIKDLFRALEFRKFLYDLENISNGFIPAVQENREYKYKYLTSLNEILELKEKLIKAGEFALDLETTSINPIEADIVGMSFSWEPNRAVYIPLMVPEKYRNLPVFTETSGNPLDKIREIFNPVFTNPDLKKCGQNIKYDWRVLRRNGMDLYGVDFDTMVAAYLINPTSREFNIDALAREYLGIKKTETKALIGKGKNQITMDAVDLEVISDYGCEDADVAYQLKEKLKKEISKSGMESLFKDVEMKLVHVLVEMEETGVAIDEKFLKKMSDEMARKLEKIKQDVFEIAGEEFNINSTQQLSTILFEKLKVHEQLGIKRIKKTKTGYSTDVSVLESLSAHPIAKKMLEYRQLSKLKSTYIDAIPDLINKKTGRVHASFNQTATATGRISSSNPNLQNIPVRTDIGREIRKAFIPQKENWLILSADYSQIELRIMAHLSGDDTLKKAFINNEDIHSRTAADIFAVEICQVSPDMRRKAKEINFGIMYGMGPYGLSRRLEIPVKEAEHFINAYFVRYPKVNDFIVRTIARGYSQGFVTTLLNRRRYLPELKSGNQNIRRFGERTAVNTPIQGTAADLIKVAMIRIADRIRNEDWQAKMILQIHDELLFEVPENEADDLASMVKTEMENAIELSVPIIADVGMGKNWFEAH